MRGIQSSQLLVALSSFVAWVPLVGQACTKHSYPRLVTDRASPQFSVHQFDKGNAPIYDASHPKVTSILEPAVFSVCSLRIIRNELSVTSITSKYVSMESGVTTR